MDSKQRELEHHIFEIKSDDDFNECALNIFRFQAENNSVYKEYIKLLKVNVDGVNSIEQIPFLPIEFFKSNQIITGNNPVEITFESSGTTGSIPSKHYVSKVGLYKESFGKGFEYFYGNPNEYSILALLPSYLERQHSSLIFMVNDLIEQSNNKDSGFYLHTTKDLVSKLQEINDGKKKVLLIGVSYALLDLAEEFELNLSNVIIMETGGMKGRREELVRKELHEILCRRFNVSRIHSEYGMTELLSQAYSKGDGIFQCPPWMKVMIRNINDPMSFLSNQKTGGINIIDLANLYSCSFIATQDLGKIHNEKSFEVLGRFDNSDLRGCNLLISE
jgi:hypothetical protein